MSRSEKQTLDVQVDALLDPLPHSIAREDGVLAALGVQLLEDHVE